MKKAAKHEDPLALAIACMESGRERYTKHADQRMRERNITRLEVREVLISGCREKRKDEFKEQYNSWNYSIKGSTIDGKILRIAISFDSNDMLIITVINLT